MSDPYMGEIKTFAFSFAPRGWSQCNGAIVALRQQTALYSLLGTAFGGDGVTTFQLPNLASRQMAGTGQGPGLTNRQLGAPFGTAAVTLDTTQIPMHNHSFTGFFGRNPPRTALPTATSAVGPYQGATPYNTTNPDSTFAPQAVSLAGGSQAHGNLQPVLGLTPCIAMTGIYPTFG